MGSCVPGPTVLKAWLSWLKSGFLLRLLGLPAVLLALHLEVYGTSPAATSLILRRLSRRVRLSSLACKFEEQHEKQLRQQQQQQHQHQLQLQLQQQFQLSQLSPRHVRSASARSSIISTPGLARHRHRSSTASGGMKPLFLLGDIDAAAVVVGDRNAQSPSLQSQKQPRPKSLLARKRSATLDNKGRTSAAQSPSSGAAPPQLSSSSSTRASLSLLSSSSLSSSFPSPSVNVVATVAAAAIVSSPVSYSPSSIVSPSSLTAIGGSSRFPLPPVAENKDTPASAPPSPPLGVHHHQPSSPSLPLLSAVSTLSPAFTPPPPSSSPAPRRPPPPARSQHVDVSLLSLTAEDKDQPPATPPPCDLFSPLPSASTASPAPSPVFTPFAQRISSPEPLFRNIQQDDKTLAALLSEPFSPLPSAAAATPVSPASPVFTASSHDLDALESASTADTLCESSTTETVCDLSPPPSPFPNFAPPLFANWRLPSPPPSSTTPLAEATAATPSPAQRIAPPAPLPIAIAASYNSPLSPSPTSISPSQTWKRPGLRPRPFSLSAVPVAFAFSPQRIELEEPEPLCPASILDSPLPSRPSTPALAETHEPPTPSPVPVKVPETPVAQSRSTSPSQPIDIIPEDLPIASNPSPPTSAEPPQSRTPRPTRSPSAPIITTPSVKQVNFAPEPASVASKASYSTPAPSTPSPLSRSVPFTPRPRMPSHSRSMSHADALKGKRLSLQHPIGSPADVSPRPQSWVAASPGLASPDAAPSPTETNILAVLAAQERYVLELKEELAKAENDLTTLKKVYATHESVKQRMDHRKITQLQPLNTTLANIGPDADDEEGSNQWMQKEMERRKALLSATKTSQRKTFSGSRHLRTLSLLSPDRSYTPSFPQPADIRNSIDESIQRPQPPVRSSTSLDIANQIHNNHRDDRYDLSGLSNIQRDALLKTGKQMANDFKDGLLTFFEDIRQATVGEEGLEAAANTKAAAAKASRKASEDRPSLERSASSKAKNSQKPTDIGDDFWKEHGLTEPKNSTLNKKTHPLKNTRTPQKNVQRLEEFEEWDSWDTPPNAAKQVPTNNSSDESDEPSSPSSGATSSRSSRDLYHAKRHDSKASSLTNASFAEDGTGHDSKRNSLVWPDLVKLSPTNLKRTASHLMKEWEKNLTPSAEAQDSSHSTGDYIGRAASPPSLI